MFIVKESRYYLFHYHPGSLAQEEIDAIIELQESCCDYICSVLGITLQAKLSYYLCNTPEEVGHLYGDDEPCNGFARMPNEIFAVYSPAVKCMGFHEDAHLISYEINKPHCAALCEGLAMFFDESWWGIHNAQWCSYYFKNDLLPSVSELMNDDRFYATDCELGYPVVGYFVQYLLNTYGRDVFLKWYGYCGKDMQEAFQTCYHRSLYEAEKEFVSHIRLQGLDASVSKRIRELLEEQE